MSSRSPIQVPDELKSKVEAMKGKFYAKTSYEVIENLVRYYEQNERFKAEERQRQEEEKRQQEVRIQARMIDVDERTKSDFVQFMASLGLHDHDHAKALAFLLCHYDTSQTVSKDALVMLQVGKM